MQKTIVPDVWTWKRWQPDRSMDFSSWFVKGDVNVAVDPLEPDPDDLKQIEELGGVAWVIVTNRDHERAAKSFVERFDAKVAASDADADELGVRVTRRLGDGELVHGWRAVELDGFKTRGEIALYSQERRTAILGDALWGDPVGSLRLMPDAKLADPHRALLSIRRVRGLPLLDNVLVGDGASIFGRGREAITACINARGIPDALRVNVADVALTPRAFHDGYRCRTGDVGLFLGAERLGYRLVELEPGDAFCPLHWHTQEEELFVVLEGSVTLVHPAGNLELVKGDCVAFPCSPEGAHKVRNDGKAACTLLMVANLAGGDVCFYPDSRKLMVERTEVIVRSEPLLSYFDGE